MAIPALSLTTLPSHESTADVLVVGSAQTPDGPVLIADAAFSAVAEYFEAIGVTGARDEVVRLPGLLGAAKSIAIVGLGPVAAALSPDALRLMAGSAVRQLTGIATLAFAVPLETDEQSDAVLEGAALGSYSFTAYRHDTLATRRSTATRIDVHTQQGDATAVARAIVIAEAMALVKDLVNTPPVDLFPQSFAQRTVDAAAGLPLNVTVWDEKRLAADGFGGILGVGQGSTRPPRLVKVSYSLTKRRNTRPGGKGHHL